MAHNVFVFQIKGVIFDSSPAFRRFYSVFRALRAVIGGPAWYNVPISFLAAIILFAYFLLSVNFDCIIHYFEIIVTFFFCFFQAYLKALIELKTPQTEPIFLAEEPYNWPQLFIYSKDDELVPCEVM